MPVENSSRLQPGLFDRTVTLWRRTASGECGGLLGLCQMQGHPPGAAELNLLKQAAQHLAAGDEHNGELLLRGLALKTLDILIRRTAREVIDNGITKEDLALIEQERLMLMDTKPWAP